MTALRWSGWWIALACALLRCILTTDPFPHWALDPSLNQLPITGLTPASSMAVDSLLMFGCAVALLGEFLAGGTILWMPVMLWAIGSVGVAVHALAIHAGSIEDGRLGVAWCAAMAAGLTAMHLCRDDRIRRVTLAAGIGLVAMLAAKGALQVFHEHEMTLANYRRNRVEFLQSQGLRPGSAAAQNFERRLNQPEATGWFGMSNVYATFAAVGFTALLGCTVVAWREARSTRHIPDGWAGLITLGAAAAALALYLADSKGGVVAAIIGVALLGLSAIVARSPRLAAASGRYAGSIAVVLVVGVLIGVACRGLIGERIHEPSLLFRWFYMEGAARTFLENPLFGTGPDGFKDAYMRLKPPQSPEEVASPHSVFFDLSARLGVFGVLWAGLWLRWVWGLGVAAWRARQEPAGGTIRFEGWMILVAVATPVLVSTWMERSMAAPEQAAARLAGLAAWVAVALALLVLLRISRTATGLIAIAALVGAIHGQIEMTPIWDSSAAWLCILLGAAGAGGPADRRRSPGAVVPPILMVGASIGTAWLLVVPASRWEGELAEAGAALRPMAEIRSALKQEGAAGIEDAQRALAELSRLTQSPAPRDEQALNQSLALLSHKLGLIAVPHLERAVALAPRHIGTRESLARLLVERAYAAREIGSDEEIVATAKSAESALKDLIRIRPSSATWGILGNVHSSLYELTRDRAHLNNAIEAWEQAERFDPYGLSLPLQRFKALLAAGRTVEAATVARRLLELDELQRLDPLKKLSAEDRAVIQRLLSGG